jgi:hypothetical protein
MRRADIEVPTPAVDGNSWAGLACYPRGSFCPMGHTPSTRECGITQPDFRPCSACGPCSQAPLCLCTLQVMSIHLEGTVGRLRYALGGDHPSQTTHLALSAVRLTERHEGRRQRRVVFHRCLPRPRKGEFAGSHLCYAAWPSTPDQAVVKLHGVFLSCRGKPASSRVLQFRRALCRDSAQVVTPFVRVGTYPTRNFATLGLLGLQPPFTGASLASYAHPPASPSGTGQESAPIYPLARWQGPVFLVNSRLGLFAAAPSPARLAGGAGASPSGRASY